MNSTNLDHVVLRIIESKELQDRVMRILEGGYLRKNISLLKCQKRLARLRSFLLVTSEHSPVLPAAWRIIDELRSTGPTKDEMELATAVWCITKEALPETFDGVVELDGEELNILEYVKHVFTKADEGLSRHHVLANIRAIQLALIDYLPKNGIGLKIIEK